ncbi:MAG: hypothetical protein ACYC0L_10045, partial [Thermoleophilia bacterium]
MLLLLAVCFWAPLAWADAAAGVATGQDQASLTAAAPGSQNPDSAPAGKSTAGNTGDGSSLKTANNVINPSSGAGGDTAGFATGTTTASAGASPSTTAAASTAPTTATAETGGSTASGSSGSAVAAQYNTNNDETGNSGCKDCEL